MKGMTTRELLQYISNIDADSWQIYESVVWFKKEDIIKELDNIMKEFCEISTESCKESVALCDKCDIIELIIERIDSPPDDERDCNVTKSSSVLKKETGENNKQGKCESKVDGPALVEDNYIKSYEVNIVRPDILKWNERSV